MPFENIVIERKDQIATVTLNYPESLNALNMVMREELTTAMDMYRDMEMTFWLTETEATLAEVEGKT